MLKLLLKAVVYISDYHQHSQITANLLEDMTLPKWEFKHENVSNWEKCLCVTEHAVIYQNEHFDFIHRYFELGILPWGFAQICS